MREGGRSLAAVINVILIVLLVLMWIGFAGFVAGALLVLARVEVGIELAGYARELEMGDRGRLLGLMLFAGAGLLAAIALVRRLRGVVATVERGEPFDEANPDRLRSVAILLALVSVLGMAGDLLLPANGRLGTGDFDVDISTWLAVLIIFVLAEVFREGARLRSEAELTV